MALKNNVSTAIFINWTHLKLYKIFCFSFITHERRSNSILVNDALNACKIVYFQDLGPPRPQKTNWCAVLLAFMSGVFFTLCSALVKGLKSIAPMELLVLRSSIQLAAMLPIVAFRGNNPFGPSGLRGLLALQVGVLFSIQFVFIKAVTASIKILAA